MQGRESENGDTSFEELPSPELLQAGYGFAMSLTRHGEDAEDLLQEACLRLCRKYGRCTEKALLFRAIRNLFLDQCRRRRVIYFETLDGHEAPESATEDEPGIAGDLEVLLDHLNPAEREVIFLMHIEGYSASEIGVLQGHPRNTVLSLAHRAMKKLRAAAEKEPAGPKRLEIPAKSNLI